MLKYLLDRFGTTSGHWQCVTAPNDLFLFSFRVTMSTTVCTYISDPEHLCGTSYKALKSVAQSFNVCVCVCVRTRCVSTFPFEEWLSISVTKNSFVKYFLYSAFIVFLFFMHNIESGLALFGSTEYIKGSKIKFHSKFICFFALYSSICEFHLFFPHIFLLLFRDDLTDSANGDGNQSQWKLIQFNR